MFATCFIFKKCWYLYFLEMAEYKILIRIMKILLDKEYSRFSGRHPCWVNTVCSNFTAFHSTIKRYKQRVHSPRLSVKGLKGMNERSLKIMQFKEKNWKWKRVNILCYIYIICDICKLVTLYFPWNITAQTSCSIWCTACMQTYA